MTGQIKRCKDPFATEVDGMIRVVTAGALVNTDDPIYNRGTAVHFEDLDDFMTESASRVNRASGVEAATAVPGEKRSVRGGRNKAADSAPESTDSASTSAAADAKDAGKS